MSQENVEIARACFDAWNAGDMDAFRELYDPDVIMRTPEGWPEPGPYVGRDAVMRQLEQNRETWDADALEPISDFIDAADRIVVRFIWRGAGHGPDSNVELTNVITVRKGRVVFQEFFWDHAEALEVMGLQEPAPSRDNVELTYRAFDAINRRDLDAHLALMDDDVEGVPRAGLMEGSYHGHAGIRRWFANLFDVFPDYAIEVVDVRDLGDVTVAALHVRGRGAGSDVPSDDAVWTAARWRRGKCVWWRNFDTEAEAIAAAELVQG